MSHVKKLAILGIRSFGPDDKRVIEFTPPLTLILGQNGCGKTTIIESLKYITTGDVPPGTGSGASFVHDPKMAKETSVRGQVKLQFCNTKGKVITASRSLEATQKPKNVAVKTIDATISTRDASGEISTISGKCNDIVAYMSMALGVSKAILNNVIFCHQEESNWPLDEGKKVKEKFDAIFSATRYIKALDSIKKIRKEMLANKKNMEGILEVLGKLKEEADRKRSDLRKAQEQQTSLGDEKDKIAEEMGPLLQRMKEIAKVEDDLAVIRGELNGKQHQLQSLREVQQELKASLSEQFTCSDHELHRMISDFENNLGEAEVEQEAILSQYNEVEREVQQRQRETAGVQRKQGELEAAHATHKKELVRRNTMMANLVQEFSFPEFDDVKEFQDQQSEAVLSLLMKHVEEERNNIRLKKEEFERSEAKTQTEIDGLRSEEAALEYKIKSKGAQLNEVTLKIRQTKQKLMRNESELSNTNFDTLKEDLIQVEEKIQSEEARVNPQKMMEEIDEEKKKRRETQNKLDEVKHVVVKMNRQAESRSQLDIHVREKKDLENKVHFLKRKHADELEHLLGEVPEENIKHKVDACASSLRNCISEVRSDIENLNKKKTQLDTTIKSHRVQIERKEKDIKGLESKVDTVCGGVDLDKSLVKTKKLKEDLTREKANLSSSITVLNRFRDKLQEKDCCPLCHRDFVTKDEVTLLIEELESKVSRIPGKLKTVKEKLEEQEKLHDQMIQLQPQQDQAREARAELERMKSQMEANLKELQGVEEDVESKTQLLEITQSDEETARAIQGDVITMENNLKKIKQLTVQIEDLQVTLGGADGGMSMEEAMARQSELEEVQRKTQMKMEELQERLREHQDQLQGYKNRKLELSKQELDLKTKMQEVVKLKEEKVKLEEDHKKFEEEKEQAQAEVTPYKYKIAEKTKEKARITKEKEERVESQNETISEILERHRSAHSTHKNIVEYVKAGKEKRLQETHEKISSLQEKIDSLESLKKSLSEQNRKLEREINSQRERKRNLDDEKKIRDKEREAATTQREIVALEKRIGGFNAETLIEEKQQLNRKGAAYQTKRAELEGRLQELEKAVRSLEADLRRKEMKEAEGNHKKKLVEMVCTEVATRDLNNYHKVLDTAVMRFHYEKMKTLNGIVRDLWRQTYKGNDVDYIEIKTKATESKGADYRQTYDYRVVMVKNDIEMDMRGRCSAGQKVLASLLIRLALAETFSSSCGVLALDEPTTNLDRENIDALAEALNDIVKARSSKASSQLIVITHDSDFLEKLARASLIEDYYEVKRNERGLSQIVVRKAGEGRA